MVKKPTKDFGYIAFGKDGTVRKEMRRLPDNKADQELRIAGEFASMLATDNLGRYEVVPLPENDHDFVLRCIETSDAIVVQLTEVVSRDYLVPLTENQYRNGDPNFDEYVLEGEIYGVDRQRKDLVLVEKIKAKIAKCYQKTDGSLWLVIWSLNADFEFVFFSSGKQQRSPAIIAAEKYIEDFGIGPFDSVWFFNPLFRPYQLLSK